MKIIFRIIMILVVASIVARAFFLAINNNSTTSSVNQSGQYQIQPMDHFEGGDRDSGSITGGLGGVLGTLAQLAGITVIVLLVRKVFSLRKNRKFISYQR